MVKTKRKTAKKPKRFVLGVGYPWFRPNREGVYTSFSLDQGSASVEDHVCLEIPLKHAGDIGHWNKIRLVAEVLK